ncbi:MAG TPA: glycosyltransferase family 2 protein [Streptosporangiaceae bacterium]|nr:glycosyltransferase family 2 protein [Streptosporangiaceae bacterium]
MTHAAPARRRRGPSATGQFQSERLPGPESAVTNAPHHLSPVAPGGLGEDHASPVRSLHDLARHHQRGGDAGDRDSDPAVLPPRHGRAGHLRRSTGGRSTGKPSYPPGSHSYDIPDVTFRPRRWLALIPLILIAGGSIYLHGSRLGGQVTGDPVLLASWLAMLAFVVVQLVLAWCQKPFTVSRRQQAQLDQLRVTVVIPCYNEDPKILDRTIASLMRQTRLPQHVEVVDDGSAVDYTPVRDYWLANQPDDVRFTWVRQPNAGKKAAQAVTFTTDDEAHVFVTIDSDSALDRRAIDEGLKPFADPRVVSVAGLETAINIDRNLLTRAMGHRSLVFQLFSMSAQSVAGGSVLINPGAFSLYWAPLIRKIVPAYLGETFFGTPVTIGDDTALTMYALLHGRAVHQPTAVSLPVYPETLAHHLKQWTRWMRASTIRMLWRARYLPILSYGWLFTVYTICSFLTSVAVTLAIPLAWPATRNLLLILLAAMVIWPWSISLRLATVRRSDQGTLSRLAGIALLPLAALWYLIVLRQMRFYGIATCWRQDWVTRRRVEVRLDSDHATPEDSQGDAEFDTAGYAAGYEAEFWLNEDDERLLSSYHSQLLGSYDDADGSDRAEYAELYG